MQVGFLALALSRVLGFRAAMAMGLTVHGGPGHLWFMMTL